MNSIQSSFRFPSAIASRSRFVRRLRARLASAAVSRRSAIRESNLALLAARAFVHEFGISAHILIDLEKTIPAGAGLGGGSSDAGTVLRMLTSMMAPMLHVSDDTPGRLKKIAAGLGADVPFFLDPRPSRVTGIGERIYPLPGFPELHLVVAVPAIEVSTRSVFNALERQDWSGAASEQEVDAIVRGQIVSRRLVNDLAAPAMRLYPQIATLKALLQECGAKATSMSGSGGAVFGLFENADETYQVAEAIRLKAPDAMVFEAESLGPLASI